MSKNGMIPFINNRYDRILFIVFLFAFCYYLFWRIYLIFLTFPNLGGAENYVIYTIQRFLDGYPLYENPEEPPFPVTQYSPLYYLIAYAVGKIIGIKPENVLQVFYLSRTLSLIYNIIHCFFIYFMAKCIFKVNTFKSFIAGISCFLLIECLSYARPDSLYFVFVLVSFFFFLKYINKKKTIYLLFNILSVALSVYSKQSGIILFFFYPFVLFFLMKKYKMTFTYISVLLLITFLLYLPFLYVDYANIYKNLVEGVNNGISFQWFWENVVVPFFFHQYGGYIFIASIYLIILQLKSNDMKFNVLAYGMIILFLFGMCTSLKYGSRPSYLTEYVSVFLVSIVAVRLKLKISKPATLLLLSVFIGTKIYHFGFPEFIKSENYITVKNNYIIEKQIYNKLLTNYNLHKEDKIFITDSIEDSKSFLNNFFYKQVLFPHKDISYTAYEMDIYNYKEFTGLLNNDPPKYLIEKENNTCLKYLDWKKCGYNIIFSKEDYFILKK
jgi:hypothetical protein